MPPRSRGPQGKKHVADLRWNLVPNLTSDELLAIGRPNERIVLDDKRLGELPRYLTNTRRINFASNVRAAVVHPAIKIANCTALPEEKSGVRPAGCES